MTEAWMRMERLVDDLKAENERLRVALAEICELGEDVPNETERGYRWQSGHPDQSGMIRVPSAVFRIVWVARAALQENSDENPIR